MNNMQRQVLLKMSALWIVPQFLNLRPKMAKVCICDNTYHKQEPCFPLFKLGQLSFYHKPISHWIKIDHVPV